MIHISASTTRRHLAFAPLIAALRQMFIAGCEVPQRHTHRIIDPEGKPIDPAAIGLPADFPLATRTVVTFRSLGQMTELTVTEYDFTAQGQMYEFAVVGLHQTLDKLAAALKAQ